METAIDTRNIEKGEGGSVGEQCNNPNDKDGIDSGVVGEGSSEVYVSDEPAETPVTTKPAIASTVCSVRSVLGLGLLKSKSPVQKRHTIYVLAILSSTGGFYFDSLLDVILITNFYISGQMFFFYISCFIMFLSSAVISIACFSSPREDHRYENAWVVAFLAFIRVQFFIEMLESLSPTCISRGYGTPLYYKIKFTIGVAASAPQATVQVFILLTSEQSAKILQLSILSALLCLSYVAYEKDKWFLKTHTHLIEDPAAKWKYTKRVIAFRTCEVISRIISLALLAVIIPFPIYIAFLSLEVLAVYALLQCTIGLPLRSSRKAAGKGMKDVNFLISMYAPCAVVIWPMALLQSKGGMARCTQIYYLARLFETILTIGLVFSEVALEMSRFDTDGA
jgi:hypothetical protein